MSINTQLRSDSLPTISIKNPFYGSDSFSNLLHLLFHKCFIFKVN